MNTVERVRNICKSRKIPIMKLENDCGLSNGYIGNLKKGSVPNDKLYLIAQYLHVSMEYLTTGIEEPQNNDFSPLEREIIQAFRSADFVDQNSVLRILGLEKKEELSESKTS